jgi:HoxN/HupN/NixA family high-affinity nickel-transporter
VAILLTGLPSGIVPGFQNFTGNVLADYLRLNMAIPPTNNPSALGVVGGDLAGFPNGRRVFDDVVTVELRAIAGVTYPLVNSSYKPDAAASLVTDGLDQTSTRYLAQFPYLGTPQGGYQFAVGIRSISGEVQSDGSTLHTATGWIGTGVSGTFLYVIAALNAVILVGIVKVFAQMRRGELDEEQLERRLNSRGLMNRFFGRFTKAITKPRHIYPIGVLFGLGFDTATEVALLFLAAGAAGAGLPFYAILCLPILFAAGMSLLDTIDGTFMNFAYGWSFSKPVRKVYYNITITAMSVLVALVIGTIEFVGLFGEKLGAEGSFWTWVASINVNELGFIIAGVFVATWAIALSIWRFGRIEERWAS